MELLKGLELVGVEIEDGKKASMYFLDTEKEEIRTVQFNKQSYDQDKRKFIDDNEKAEKVEKWCNEFFNCTFDNLESAVGAKKDVYVYDMYCSLWEVDQVDKFKEEDVNLIDSGKIKEIICDNVGIKIRIEYNDKTYESKMSYSVWLDAQNKFITDPQKKIKQFEKFKDKFGVSIENKDKLVGTQVMFEVKRAMGKYIYIEIKKNSKKK